jgi:hypothetical protein
MKMELNKNIKAAVDAEQPLYWQLDGDWLELRAISYTWENGKERTKQIQIYYLKEQLKEIVETQKALGSNAPKNFIEELDPAYWKKVIDIHPRNLLAKEE